MFKRILLIQIISLMMLSSCASPQPVKTIAINAEDQACQYDSDCVNTLTNCQAMSCECYGTPINQAHKQKYADLLQACQMQNRVQHQLFACNIDCTNTPRLINKCVEGRCQLVEEKRIPR